MNIRVVLVSDNALLLGGMRALAAACTGFEVVGEGRARAAALGAMARKRPHVVVLALDDDALEFLEMLCAAVCPASRVLVVTASREPGLQRRILRAGATGILPKEQLVECLPAAVRELHAGRAWIDGALVASAVGGAEGARAAAAPGALTPREREIAALVSRGLNNRQIAAHLFLSEGTVRNHLTVIFRKLGIADRCDLIVRWLDRRADAPVCESPSAPR